MKEPFNLENQYQEYLTKVKLDESEMHPVQQVETRRAFMGACGQMLMLFKDELVQIESEEEAILTYSDLIKQVNIFFKNEINPVS